ncbi:transporter substrate-binding domain-containing protein [Pseudomonas sp. Irchel s3a18]|uniref:transporter substrate-binding domain-containing protein n=1 Tax=Pseudomonas sp. Irchel s3a18 TaxID=2009053 RepID=UPI000BA30B71|nr:transporter substrate-binding domain-containing protein [Pseudomonas sp. Irchel s3a18]
MPSLRKCLPVAVLVLLSLWTSLLQAGPQTYNLVGRSSVDGYHVVLDDSDWLWLRSKGTLVLGASAPEYPPFGITNNGNDYEGLSADYAQLLGQLLQVDIKVQRYSSREDVIKALKTQQIDFLGTSNNFEAEDPQLVLSSAYADDQPTLVSRTDDTQDVTQDLAGKRLAMVYYYLPPTQVQAFYPKARLQLYPSTLSAIGAVAFGQADVYIGDAIGANYLILKNYLNNVQLVDFSRMEANDFSFALRRDDQRLLRIINAALAAIPTEERLNILRRWNAGGASLSGKNRVQFTASEQRWLNAHPRVRVAVDGSFVPFSFFTREGEFRGVAADVLARLTLRTGLKFDVQQGSSVPELIDRIESKQADLLVSLTPSIEREHTLRFTRPYLNTPYVLVSRIIADAPPTLDEMTGRRLVLTRGSAIKDMVAERYPGIRLLVADNAQIAMNMVASGEADAAVSSLISARYMISRQFRDQLQITSTVGTSSAHMAFATARDSPELFSILDKAMFSIPPEEMDELTNRWRSEAVIEDSYWLRYRSTIIQGFAIAGLLLLVALGWIGYLRVLIRKREQAERALNDQLEFMRVLIDGTPHPIYVRDRQGRMMACNHGYLEVFGVERDAVIGQTVICGQLKSVVEAKAFHEEYLQVMEEGLPRVRDRQLTLSEHDVRTIYHWMLPYRGSDGRVSGMIGGWIDVSERQQLLEQLREAKDEADEANRAKTTFLATMSHEIRTPMNAVIGMLELAMKKADQGVMDRFAIEVASGAARGLLELIGDILDISRIESGHLSLAPERANLRSLVESAARIFDGLARQKQLHLHLEVDAIANQDVLIDPLRFKQVVSNLLSNAIKFTAEGQVRLSVRGQSVGDAQRLQVVVRVEDSGSGICEADQQRLFNPFSQASNNIQSARSGCGLGLMISRTLCDMMGGTLELSSVLGQGTQIEVTLELPILEPLVRSVQPMSQLPPQGQMLNILVIDDYPANRLLVSQQLTYLGHRVKEAQDGAHGLRAWRGQHFDVVITDCNMPVMNGYELARAIRSEERAGGITPGLILGFTANAQPQEKQRCREAGMDGCLFKPISLRDLSAFLACVAPDTVPVPTKEERRTPADAIDLTNLEQLTRGDEALIKSLLGDLASSNEEDISRLLSLFTHHDVLGLADLAHRVKGGARIIKAQGLIHCCERLESACEEGGGEQLTAAVDALQQAMERLADTLEQRAG